MEPITELVGLLRECVVGLRVDGFARTIHAEKLITRIEAAIAPFEEPPVGFASGDDLDAAAAGRD